MPSTFEDEQEALAYTTRDYLCECGHHVDAHAPITDMDEYWHAQSSMMQGKSHEPFPTRGMVVSEKL